MINNDYSYYDLGKCDHDNYCHISNIVNDSSFNENTLNDSFKQITKETLIGETDKTSFTVKKIVVLEMK